MQSTLQTLLRLLVFTLFDGMYYYASSNLLGFCLSSTVDFQENTCYQHIIVVAYLVAVDTNKRYIILENAICGRNVKTF